MTVLAEQVVLRFHDARERAHQHTALAGEIAKDFVLECRGKEIARANRDSQRNRPLVRASGRVLLNRETGIDAAARKEIGAHTRARTFGRDENHIHEIRRDDAGLLFVHNRKAVGKVERVALFQTRFDLGPRHHLRGVRNQVLNNRAALGGFFERKERFALHPAVLMRLVPAIFVLASLSYDDVDAVVAHVERLCGPLHAVTQDGDDLVLQDLSRLVERKLVARDDLFDYSAKIDLCHVFSSS